MLLAKLLFADVASLGSVAEAVGMKAPVPEFVDSIDDVPLWMLDIEEPEPWVYKGPSDDAITSALAEAKAAYEDCLAKLDAEPEGECEVADIELGGNAFHQIWLMATEAIAVAAGELEQLDLNRLTADLLKQPDEDFDPVEYLKAATQFLESGEQEHELASARFTVAPAPSADVVGSHQRRLLACYACWPWELGHRGCWCDCDNDGSLHDGCSFFCPCKSGYSCQPGHHKCYHYPRKENEPCVAGHGCGTGLQCEAGSQRCRGKGDVGDGCHLTRPCKHHLSCQPGVHKCYHDPREENEPCSLGFGCRTGLNCEAGSQKCRRPSELGESCHATRPCRGGLYCKSGIHKCKPMGDGVAKKCANENERCYCNGVAVYGRRFKPSSTSELAYGAMHDWPVAWKKAGNFVDCKNGIFGDPIFGHLKHCYCVE